MNPEITVIVATYNQETTIRRTLDSILAQKTDFPIEILVGEDGGTDRTRSICEDYVAKYPGIVRLMPKAPNKGLVDNYYDCVLYAKGKYIADCAGDDYWTDDSKLQRQYDILESDPDISLIHTAWKYHNQNTGNIYDYVPNDTVSELLQPVIDGKRILRPLLCHEGMIVHLCTALYRRDILMKEYNKSPELFRSSDYTCEDLQLLATMAARGKIAYISKPMLNYSVGHGSISSESDAGKNFDFYFPVMKLNMKLAGYFGIDLADIGNYIETIGAYLVSQAFYSADNVRRDKIVDYLSGFEFRGTLKTKIYAVLMRLPKIWRVVLRFYSGRYPANR